MGATGWRYRIEYTDDPEDALQAIRQRVFQHRQYPFEESWPAAARNRHPLLWFTATAIGKLHNLFLKARIGRATDIPRLVEQAGETGTHSILDITHTSKYPDFATASPAPERILIEVFGTVRPTAEDYDSYIMGELANDELTENLDRWQSYYFLLYEDEQPRWLCFEGYSGD